MPRSINTFAKLPYFAWIIALVLLAAIIYLVNRLDGHRQTDTTLAKRDSIRCVNDFTDSSSDLIDTLKTTNDQDYGFGLGVNPTLNAPNCNIALQNGYYDYEYLKKDSADYKYFTDYLYKSDLHTKEDVIKAGFDASIPIPLPDGSSLALLDAAGNFNKSVYDQWHSTYEHNISTKSDIKTASLYLRQNVPEFKYKYWLECYKLIYQRKDGFFAVLRPVFGVNSSYAELLVKWNAFSGIDSSNFERNISYNDGGIASCEAINYFRKGARIGSKELRLLFKRDINKPLIVELFPKPGNNVNLFLPQVLVGHIEDFRVLEDKAYVGDSITVNWRVLNGRRIRLNGQDVRDRSKHRIKIDDTNLHTFILTSVVGKDRMKSDSIVSDTISFQATVRPTTLQHKAEYVMATPGWANGKNDDDSNVFVDVTVVTSTATIIGHGEFGNSSGIPKGQERHMDITFDPNQARTIIYDQVLRVEVAIRYQKPNAGMQTQDQWRARTQLILNFDQGKQLVSPGVDPAHDFHFSSSPQMLYESFQRAQLGTIRTLKSPCG